MVANRILDALPTADRARLAATMAAVSIEPDAVLFEPGQVIDGVYFLQTGVVALVGTIEQGATVEVATVGNEGVVGVPLVAGGFLAVRAISAVRGTALRMEASAFLEELDRGGALSGLVQTYIQGLFGQISQAVGCNRLHSNEQRLSRWLLLAQDRAAVDEFAISQGFLVRVLGISAQAATLTVDALVSSNLIRKRGGQVTIVDRSGLLAAACECYGTLTGQLEGVVR